MSKLLLGVVLSLSVLTTGCAIKVQQPVALEPTFWEKQDSTVGVIATEVPTPDTYLPGAGCLLCYAAASAANSSLTKHFKTLPNDSVKNLKNEVVKLLESRGVKTSLLTESLKLEKLPRLSNKAVNAADRDFSTFAKSNVDYLLVLDINQLGAVRTYSSYIPTSDPQAVLSGRAFLVDLKSNTYVWYSPINAQQAASGEWDEPPTFPGMTEAYYEVVDRGMNQVLQPLQMQQTATTNTTNTSTTSAPQ